MPKAYASRDIPKSPLVSKSVNFGRHPIQSDAKDISRALSPQGLGSELNQDLLDLDPVRTSTKGRPYLADRETMKVNRLRMPPALETDTGNLDHTNIALKSTDK